MRTVLSALLALTLAGPAAGGELAGVTLAESTTIGGHHLVLNGMALRKKAIFKVYVAGLYLGEKTASADAILAADAPRRGVMQYVRKVTKAQLCDGWDEGLAANTPDAADRVREQFRTLCEWMEDVKDGEQIVFTYLPGSGTQIDVKGAMKGKLEGKPFADALFACWLGPKPGPGEDFKTALLDG